jgi:hypothetical protein
VPWSFWERRNSIIQQLYDSSGSGLLDGGVTTEILRYAARFYEDALVRVVKCVDHEQLFESNPALANLLISGAMEESPLRSAFVKFRDRQHFRLGSNAYHSFDISHTRGDRNLDEELQALGVESYRLNLG